jgi:diguanylate cyclase (GGDEF)-like protein
MISIKKYLEEWNPAAGDDPAVDNGPLLAPLRAALCSLLTELGSASAGACASVGEELRSGLAALEKRISAASKPEEIAGTETEARQQVREWGQRLANHLEQKTAEAKDILLVLAQTAGSMANRDHICAEQIGAVTARLKKIATLDDLTEVRASIERSASELKVSIDRMAAESKNAVEHLRLEVKTYQAKLEAAEYVSSFDALTGLSNRQSVENELQKRVASDAVFSIIVLDIDNFKIVNDTYGHVSGDEVLKQFASELKSASRASDTIGRWGGDEFIVLLEGGKEAARVQSDRIRQWACGRYTIKGRNGPIRIDVNASIGLAEHRPGESSKDLFDRADAEMYQRKNAEQARATA